MLPGLAADGGIDNVAFVRRRDDSTGCFQNGWHHVAIWNMFKMLWTGPISVVLLIRAVSRNP